MNNDIQIVGVAHGVSLWTSKIGAYAPDPGYAACGVQFGRTNGVDAINMSTTLSPYTALTDQINAAYNQNGIVIVIAAGNTNGGAVTYPATLAAPGTTVTGVRGLTTTCLGGVSCNFSGFRVEGTSFAAPHVAAAAALLKAYNPGWSNAEIRRRLGAGAIDLGAAGRDAQFGFGLLSITGAIAADPPQSPPPLSVSIDGPTQIQPGATCTWYAAVGNGTPPYTYQWTASQMAPPSGTDYYFTASKDAGSFATSWPLRVVVTDAAGGSGEHEITVYEDPSAFTCTI